MLVEGKTSACSKFKDRIFHQFTYLFALLTQILLEVVPVAGEVSEIALSTDQSIQVVERHSDIFRVSSHIHNLKICVLIQT
jgi:hypothetical protein